MAKFIVLTYDEIKNAIDNSSTMGEAALYFKCSYRTFKSRACFYGLYKPVRSKLYHGRKFLLSDILAGKHPSYPTSHLSKRLVSEKIKDYRCECCNINSYNGQKISLELDHIDGISHNHQLSNLRLLCPNCHSQTSTYKGKNIKKC